MVSGHVIAEIIIVGIIEKKLGDHEIRARVDFLFEMDPIDELAVFAGDVAFWKSSYPD